MHPRNLGSDKIVGTEHAVNKKSKNYPPFRHVFHMQTSDLNVNNTESDHATAIFRKFQDAIFSREHTSVKTSTKIIFDLLQCHEIATLSLPEKAAIASFISTTFRGYFCLRANDIARNRSRVIFSRACADIFRRWIVKTCRSLQGWKTFCASFCASLIAGSRRAFLCVDCVRQFVCLSSNDYWKW